MNTPVMERTLIDRLKAHDRSAVADLSTAYGSKIAQLALRYLRNREDAEEVAQDVLLKVYQKIDAFRGDAALSSWIYRITFNTVMSRLRDSKRALRDLPELYRTPVVLRDIHGLTTEEASAVLRVNDQTLKSRLHRGRLILRARLAEFAGGLALHPPASVH